MATALLSLFEQYPTNIFNYRQLSAKLDIQDATGRLQVVEQLEALLTQGKIEMLDKGKYKLVKSAGYHTGTIQVLLSGNAYFICDDLDHDIYIPARNLNTALHHDIVKVYVYKRKKSSKEEGDIVEIIKRYKLSYVGVLQVHKNFGFVIPDDKKMYADIFINKKYLKNAQHGDKVLASITDWPLHSKNPFGKIKEVLGAPGDHTTEIHAILLEHGLPYKFPDKIEEEALKLTTEISADEIAKRKDMRSVLTFTIDPKDAKDFDDALSFKQLANGNYQIGIHIADVSHYVTENSVLDEEAYQRATSVYLVDRVVPMLPEVLSNGLCSLRPEEEKLTFSAIFELNDKAQVIDQWFGRTVIYSDQRFSYEEAQELIENNQSCNSVEQYNNKVSTEVSISGTSYTVDNTLIQSIILLNTLAKKLRKKRLNHGAISFDRSEVKFELDNQFDPVGVYFKESKDAHKMIEEFMLLANKKVAEFIGCKQGKPTNKTFIYRTHDEPDLDKLNALQSIIKKFGYKNTIDTSTKISTSRSLNTLLKDVHGTGESNMIETLTIRSMSKAEYTTDNIGHYGLAFDYYAHFTSPIRRYPDVMTHRLLQHYLSGGTSPKAALYEEKCKHASEREQLAARAERDSIKYMQVKYMQAHKDLEYEGVISGVTEWGIYVEIIENKCEGMCRIRDIKDDYYIYDEKNYAIVGQATKNIYQLGDHVLIKVKKTDLERKHLDFTLLEKL